MDIREVLYPDMYLRWKILCSPHAAGTDRGNPRDAGKLYACQVHIWISNINKIVVLKGIRKDAFLMKGKSEPLGNNK